MLKLTKCLLLMTLLGNVDGKRSQQKTAQQVKYGPPKLFTLKDYHVKQHAASTQIHHDKPNSEGMSLYEKALMKEQNTIKTIKTTTVSHAVLPVAPIYQPYIAPVAPQVPLSLPLSHVQKTTTTTTTTTLHPSLDLVKPVQPAFVKKQTVVTIKQANEIKAPMGGPIQKPHPAPAPKVSHVQTTTVIHHSAPVTAPVKHHVVVTRTLSITPPSPIKSGEFEIAGRHINIYHRQTALDTTMALVFLILMLTLIVMAFVVVIMLINIVKQLIWGDSIGEKGMGQKNDEEKQVKQNV